MNEPPQRHLSDGAIEALRDDLAEAKDGEPMVLAWNYVSKTLDEIAWLRAREAEIETRLSGPGRYLVDGGRGQRVFDTLGEAREWANTQIEAYREKANRTGKWPGRVQNVAIWVAIEQARAVPVEDGHDFELKPLCDQEGESEP